MIKLDTITEILFKRFSAKLSEEEQSMLDNWLTQSANNRVFFDKINDEEQLRQLILSFGAQKREHSQERVLEGLRAKLFSNKEVEKEQPARRIHFLKTYWFRYAAAIIVMLGVGAYLWFGNTTSIPANPKTPINPGSDIHPGSDRAILTLANGQQIILDNTQGNIVKQGKLTVVNLAGKLKYEGVGTAAEYNTISTPKGGQYQITLPDGSKVWLNAASSIKFPTAFATQTREVEMTGEAYLEIAKNSKQPFMLKTKGLEVQVLGTSFNVNAYSDEESIKTTLIEGSVRVKATNEVILKPASTAIFVPSGLTEKERQLKVINNVDIEQTLAWKNGLFQFNHSNLADVMRQLARWYDVEIVYEKGVRDIKLDGEMKRDLSLSQVLKGLNRLGVKSKIEGKRLIIMSQ